MPGIYGVMDRSNMGAERLSALGSRMAAALRTQPWLLTEQWCAPGLCAGRVHLGILHSAPQPIAAPGASLRAWFDGLVYPEDEKRGRAPTGQEVDAWLRGGETAFAGVDGEYALALWEKAEGRLTLVTDRLGYRPLYVAQTRSWFAYASEVKAILAIMDRTPPLDRVALRQFLAFQRIWGRRTWWEGIELLPPAALLRVDHSGRRERRYWSFDDIRREPRPIEEVIPEFVRLWSRSIARRRGRGPMPHLLSGGLDSRLVMAELRRQGQPLTAFTFGEPGCADMRIAARAARVAGVEHRRLPFDEVSWWHGRATGIWQTDGHASAVDLHAVRAADALRMGCRQTIKHGVGNNLPGGLLPLKYDLGGWPSTGEYEARIRFHDNPFICEEEAVEASGPDIEPVIDGPSPVAVALLASARRKTLPGCYALMAHCEVLIPGIDLEILRLLVGGLTDEQRHHGGFYRPFLTSRYPEYFRDIPWQQTGRGLDESWPVEQAREWVRRIGRKLGRPVGRPAYFADYDRLVASSAPLRWLRGQELLTDHYMDGAASRYLENVPGEKGWSRHALTLLTIETYLRQVEGRPTAAAERPAGRELPVPAERRPTRGVAVSRAASAEARA